MICMGCGVEKDLNALEAYPYEDLDNTPACPLLVVEVLEFQKYYKACVVCYECFHNLDVDMWIDKKVWESINPTTPFENLPELLKDKEAKWKPEFYQT